MERKLKLKDVLAYLVNEECDVSDLVQISLLNDGWEHYTQIAADSPLLEAYCEWDVTVMGAELSDYDDPIPVIRVTIRRPERWTRITRDFRTR